MELGNSSYSYKLSSNTNYYITIDPNFMKFTDNCNNEYPNINVLYLYNTSQPIYRPSDKSWYFTAQLGS